MLGRRRGRCAAGALAPLALAILVLAPLAKAAGPLLGDAWTSAVLSSSARLNAQVNPNGLVTAYRFEFIPAAAYEANLGEGKDGFTGGRRAPAGSDASAGDGSATITVGQTVSSLSPDTEYRYRFVAHNTSGTATGSVRSFSTQEAGGGSMLDDRGWEMVSPVDKNGGQVEPAGAIAGGGVLQAAAAGAAVTYGSPASFAGGSGAPPASQYIARRGDTGWSTENVTVPIFAGSFGAGSEGVPYRLFSGDLVRGLLLNGRHCRGEATGCPVANPPLAGTDAPAGYQNYYLRQAGGGFEALLGAADVADLALEPAEFELGFAGASPDLRQVVLSTCAALTADATEAPSGEGCDSSKPNLYLWSEGSGLSLLNLLPAQAQGTPGAALGAQSRAVSGGGARVYWTDLATGNLYLRAAAQTAQVDAAAGGGGSFETASADGLLAYFTKAAHLWRYDALAASATDLTPTGGVVGVLGASESGSRVYYQDAGGLKLWQDGTTTTVAAGAQATMAGSYPPSSGTARVSADGAHLLFVSKLPLTGYDNTDLFTGEPDSQVYLYDAGADELACVSCNPTNARPLGPSTIPAATANGAGANAPHSYKPRVLSADGGRVFFDSADALALTDTNGETDVYEWEAQGRGSCARPAGCVALISSGRSDDGASFFDASADGDDAFFITDASLVSADPGSRDLYDARVGGGFPEPSPPIPCKGDACQVLPPEPVDPTLTTLLTGLGNPPVDYTHARRRCGAGFVKRKGRCVKRKQEGKHRKRGARRGGGR